MTCIEIICYSYDGRDRSPPQWGLLPPTLLPLVTTYPQRRHHVPSQRRHHVPSQRLHHVLYSEEEKGVSHTSGNISGSVGSGWWTGLAATLVRRTCCCVSAGVRRIWQYIDFGVCRLQFWEFADAFDVSVS